MESSEIRRLELKAEQIRSMLKMNERRAAEISSSLSRERGRYQEGVQKFSDVKKQTLQKVKGELNPRVAVADLQSRSGKLIQIRGLLQQKFQTIEALLSQSREVASALSREKTMLSVLEEKIAEHKSLHAALAEAHTSDALHELAYLHKNPAVDDDSDELGSVLEKEADVPEGQDCTGESRTSETISYDIPYFSMERGSDQHSKQQPQHQAQHQFEERSRLPDSAPNSRTSAFSAQHREVIPSGAIDQIKEFTVVRGTESTNLSLTYTTANGRNVEVALEKHVKGGISISLAAREPGTGRLLRAQVGPLLNALRTAGVQVRELRIAGLEVKAPWTN